MTKIDEDDHIIGNLVGTYQPRLPAECLWSSQPHI